MRANARDIISLTTSADDSCIISVDDLGDVCSWDALFGGDSAWTVSTKLGFRDLKYVTHKKRSCRRAISRDGKYFLWAMRGRFRVWKAKLIDLGLGEEVKEIDNDYWSDGYGFYRSISDFLERDGIDISLGWRFSASFWSRFIELSPGVGSRGTDLKVCPGGVLEKDPPVFQVGGSCVRCFLETTDLAVLSNVEFNFGKTAGSFAAGWAISCDDGSRQVTIACWTAQSNRLAILHLIPSRV